MNFLKKKFDKMTEICWSKYYNGIMPKILDRQDPFTGCETGPKYMCFYFYSILPFFKLLVKIEKSFFVFTDDFQNDDKFCRKYKININISRVLF